MAHTEYLDAQPEWLRVFVCSRFHHRGHKGHRVAFEIFYEWLRTKSLTSRIENSVFLCALCGKRFLNA